MATAVRLTVSPRCFASSSSRPSASIVTQPCLQHACWERGSLIPLSTGTSAGMRKSLCGGIASGRVALTAGTTGTRVCGCVSASVAVRRVLEGRDGPWSGQVGMGKGGWRIQGDRKERRERGICALC